MLLEPEDLMLFDGDSLTSRRRGGSMDTWPYLRMMNWHQTWADEVERLLFALRPELDLRFRNAAISGSASIDLLEKFDHAVRPYSPDWVILTCGGNDLNRGIDLDDFRRNLSEYSRAVTEECDGRMAFLACWVPCPGAPEHKAEAYPRRAEYYGVLRELAEEFDGLYIDACPAMEEKAELLYEQSEAHTVYSDGGHFNELGNLIIAGEVLKAFGFSF